MKGKWRDVERVLGGWSVWDCNATERKIEEGKVERTVPVFNAQHSAPSLCRVGVVEGLCVVFWFGGDFFRRAHARCWNAAAFFVLSASL